jgi:hypothetical protein
VPDIQHWLLGTLESIIPEGTFQGQYLFISFISLNIGPIWCHKETPVKNANKDVNAKVTMYEFSHIILYDQYGLMPVAFITSFAPLTMSEGSGACVFAWVPCASAKKSEANFCGISKSSRRKRFSLQPYDDELVNSFVYSMGWTPCLLIIKQLSCNFETSRKTV